MHITTISLAPCNHSSIKIDISRWHDTMVKALVHSLSDTLGALCEVLSVPLERPKIKKVKF